jgi:KDO2-lipid IV(A) lauroyltransferase
MSKPNLNLQALANTSFATNLALTLGQLLPSFIGRPLAKMVADAIVRQPGSQMVRVLRTNLWVASEYTLSAAELDQQVHQVFRKHIRSLWDFYHNLNRPKKVVELVSFSPKFQALFDQARVDHQPRLFLTVHTSNFELAGRVLALRGLEYQILSVPQPPSGYQVQNKFRRDVGMEVTPMSVEAFQKARERLRHGGTVLTGIDRPLAQTRHKVRFFGRPALLPVAYIQLALQTGAPMILVACVSKPDGSYELTCSDPVIAEPNSDRDQELISNAEAVLAKAEEIIRPRPTDWCMFYPIWPELDEAVPL